MNVVVDPAAVAELAAEVDWLEERRVGLGLRLLQAVDAKLARIAQMPSSFPIYAGMEGVRRAFLRPFRMQIVFTQRTQDLYVLAFAATSRAPGYCATRMAASSRPAR